MAPAADSPSADTALSLPSPQVFDILVNLNNLMHRLLAEPPSVDDHQPQLHARQAAIAVKDYATEALKIKNSLIEARKAVQGLPDVDRSLIEQEAEIRRLERAIIKKREMLSLVGTRAGESVNTKTDEGGKMAQDP